MIKIHKLKRPMRTSGDNLPVGKTFKKKGMLITNVSAGPNVYVDPFTRKPPKKKKKKARKAKKK